MWLMLLIIVVSVLLLWLYSQWKISQYWEKRNVKHTKPFPFLGDMGPIIFKTLSFGPWTEKIYKTFPNERFVGFHQFVEPILMLRDPELIKQVMDTEYENFNHLEFVSQEIDPLWAKNIIALQDHQQWLNIRAFLIPLFTINQLQKMFPLFKESTDQFIQYLETQNGTVVLEMRDTFTRFAVDVVGRTVYGINSDSLKYRENTFYRMGENAGDFRGYKAFAFFLYTISPSIMKRLKLKIYFEKVSKYFWSLLKTAMKERDDEETTRPVIINLMMKSRKGQLEDGPTTPDTEFTVTQEPDSLKNNKINPKIGITDDDLAAHAILYFFFDLMSAIAACACYEIAVNPDVQKKLMDEVLLTLNQCNGDVTYEALRGMKYFDMVISETIRKWPSNEYTERMNVKPFTIKGKPNQHGDILIDAKTNIWIPIYAIHRDPKYFPDPEKFDPERFNENNRKRINPYTLLTFGVGPKNCSAIRLVLLQTKLVIFEILRKHQIVPVEKTQIPLQLKKGSVTTVPERGIWLGFKPKESTTL